MKRASIIFFGLAALLLATTIGLRIAGVDNPSPLIMTSLALALSIAVIAYIIHAFWRLRNGSVRLRPREALIDAVPMLVVMASSLLVVWILLGGSKRQMVTYLVSAFSGIILSSLHFTAYRKPV